MSMVEDIKVYLADEDVTQRIMLLRMPDNEPIGAVDTIALFQYTGDDPWFIPEKPGLAYERPRLQVLTRSDDPETSGGMANNVFHLLSRIVNMTINGNYYLRITPNGSPFLLQRDEAERTIWSANYKVIREAIND